MRFRLFKLLNKLKRTCKNGCTEFKLSNSKGSGMKIYKIRTHAEYLNHKLRNKQSEQEHQEFLKNNTPNGESVFFISGYSYTAGKQVDFLVDYQHSGGGPINWRERVCCPETYFNNRMRATFHLFDIEMEPYPDSEIYITEQITPIYTYFKNRYPNTIGSEFLGEKCSFGCKDENGVRNETITALTFPDQSFDILISLDVLEHVPDYQLAFKECARVLRKGGKMMWSVPFAAGSPKNIVRAKIHNGEIVHILPPEFHGDPLSSEGVLCFQHFGWEMLDQMREAGFSDVYALCFHSSEFGYLGGEQLMFVAIK
jgi:hypothetical protein